MFNKNENQNLVSYHPLNHLNIKEEIVAVLRQEAEAINTVADNLPSEAISLVELIIQTKGRLVFSGMGKSGAVAKKLVATFSSTGTPAIFLHPSEALHGDLGMVQPNDLFIALSKSGSGLELEQIVQVLRSTNNNTSLICCSKGSLSSLTHLTVTLPFNKEACPLNLAPTSSSTMMLAFGDAIAITVSKMRGFNKNDFAKLHPHGALGKRLTLKVKSIMAAEDKLPLLNPKAYFSELILTITSKALGIGIVVDENKKLLGIVTDGDLRRSCKLFGPDIFTKFAIDIMTPNPRTITPAMLAQDALIKMEKYNITTLVVVEQINKVVGIVHIHDIIKAGLNR